MKLYLLLPFALAGAGIALAAAVQVPPMHNLRGEIATTRDLIKIDSIEPAVIRALHVKRNEKVVAGQPLMELENAMAEAELASSASSLVTLEAQVLRLTALLDGKDSVVWPDNIPLGVRAREEQQFVEDRGEEVRKSEALRAEILTYAAEAGSFEAEARGLGGQLGAAQRSLADLERKAEISGAGSERNAKREDVASLAQRISTAQQRGRAAGLRTEQTKSQLVSVEQTLRRERQTQLNQAKAKIAELSPKVNAAGDRANRLILTAPEAGTVQDIAITTLGAEVAKAQQTLITMVPRDAHMQVKVQITQAQRPDLAPGMAAAVDVAGFDRRTHGHLTGTLTEISPTVNRSQDGKEVWYAGVITLDQQGYGQGQNFSPLLPAMGAEVTLEGAPRSFLGYMFQSVTDAVRYSMTER